MPEIFLLLFIKRNHLPFISVVWVFLVLLINPYGEFPFNDDWAYAQSVKALVETQTFFMSAWTSVNLVVQVGWGALFCLPFGFSFTALRISTLAAGLLGLWGTYRFIYISTENRSVAFLGALILLVNPMYLGLSASFMTDVPFYALMVWSLSFLVTGLKKDSVWLMLTGIGLAVLALLVRQFGIALFVGFGVAYVVRKGINLKSMGVAFVSIIAGLGTQMIYQRWLLYMMPGMISYNVQASNFFHLSFYKWQMLHDFIHNVFITLMYTGVFIFPYFLWLLSKNGLSGFRTNRWLWLALTGVIVSLWYYFFDWAIMPLWFNTLNAYGVGPMLLRDLYYHFYQLPVSRFLYFLMICVTISSVAGSVGILFYFLKLGTRLLQRPINLSRWVIAVFLLAVMNVYYFPIGMHIVFDRYLLPLPALVVILIHLAQPWSVSTGKTLPVRWSVYLTIVWLGAYLLFSLGATHDYMAWNRVRWQALHTLIEDGVRPTEIDGGLEFNGLYLYNAAYKSASNKSWWWVDKDTYVLGTSVLPGYRLFRQYPVETWFPWGIRMIYIGKKKTEQNESF